MQPSGTVKLVFTDIDGSTRLLEELGQERYRQALAEHREHIRSAFATGYEVDYEGDSFFYAFASASAAVAAVREALGALAEGPIKVRVGIHTGEPGLDPPKYVGMDVHRAARILSCATKRALSPSGQRGRSRTRTRRSGATRFSSLRTWRDSRCGTERLSGCCASASPPASSGAVDQSAARRSWVRPCAGGAR